MRTAGWALIVGGVGVIGLCFLDLLGSSPFHLLSRDLVRWPLETAAVYAIYVGVGMAESNRD
ncbi:MAG: hypothetical protein ABIV94_05835 [Acidimicrobiales bacterium]